MARFWSEPRSFPRRMIVQSGVDPEDIVQETLLAIHLKRNTWISDAPVLPAPSLVCSPEAPPERSTQPTAPTIRRCSLAPSTQARLQGLVELGMILGALRAGE